MLDTARRRLRETVSKDDPPEVVDAKVAEAAPGLDDELRAALWLYAWHQAGDEGARRFSREPR
jgi:hypothetical protein